MLAGHHGVPAVYASGDAALAAEARALVPGVTVTVVKHGITRTAARLERPEEARARIRADVERALLQRDAVAPLVLSGEPLRLTFTRVPFCDAAAAWGGARRLDGRTVEIGGDDFAALYRGFLACLDLAALAG